MSAPASRRGFLRGLTTLPLIGGGVTLIGAPSAVAAPCTDAVMTRYLAWLAREHYAASIEVVKRDCEAEVAAALAVGRPSRPDYVDDVVRAASRNVGGWWFPDDDVAAAVVASAPVSSRAALVLAAVGADMREGSR